MAVAAVMTIGWLTIVIAIVQLIKKVVDADVDGVITVLAQLGIPEWAREGVALLLVGAFQALREQGGGTSVRMELNKYKQHAATMAKGQEWQHIVIALLELIAAVVEANVDETANALKDLGVPDTIATIAAFALVRVWLSIQTNRTQKPVVAAHVPK